MSTLTYVLLRNVKGCFDFNEHVVFTKASLHLIPPGLILERSFYIYHTKGSEENYRIPLFQRTTKIHTIDMKINSISPYFTFITITVHQRHAALWISNRTPSKVWDEITYPFPNFNGATVEVWGWIGNFIPPFIMDVIT